MIGSAKFRTNKPRQSDIAVHFGLDELHAVAIENALDALYSEQEFIDFKCNDKGTYKTISIDLTQHRTLIFEMDPSRSKMSLSLIKDGKIDKIAQSLYQSDSAVMFNSNLSILCLGLSGIHNIE